MGDISWLPSTPAAPSPNVTTDVAVAVHTDILKTNPPASEEDLRALILDAAAAIGMDGSGQDGLLGYLKHVATIYPRQFVGLLSKVLPLQVEAKMRAQVNSNVAIIGQVNIVSVPAGKTVDAKTLDATVLSDTIESLTQDTVTQDTDA